MQSDYKEIYPDQPIAEGYNSDQRELETPSFSQGEKPELSPNPGYGENINSKFLDACVKIASLLTDNSKIKFRAKIRYGNNRLTSLFESGLLFGNYDSQNSLIYFRNVDLSDAKSLEVNLTIPKLRFYVEDLDYGTVVIESFDLDVVDTDSNLIPYFKGVGVSTADATKLKTQKGEDVSKTFPKVEQEGIKVERDPVNFIGGLYVKGKPVEQYVDEKGGVSQAELDAAVGQVIPQSLLNGELKTVFQNKSLSVSDFPLESDIDNQHEVVNEGKLPNGDMDELTESDIAKLTLTLNRIINKGWLKTSSSSAIRLSSVLYSSAGIFIVASNVVFTANNTISNGSSYKIFLDPANATYEYSAGSYSA